MDNRERILAIVRKVSDQSAAPGPDESLFDSGYLDSFALPDMVAELEREFGIKIPRNELFPESIFQGDPDFVQNGKVTQKGLDDLRQKMPFADISKFEKNPDLTALSDLFTVDMITKHIEGKLNGSYAAAQAAAPVAGHAR